MRSTSGEGIENSVRMACRYMREKKIDIDIRDPQLWVGSAVNTAYHLGLLCSSNNEGILNSDHFLVSNLTQ